MNLISDEYREQNSHIHKNQGEWGTTGKRFAPAIRKIFEENKCKDALDYGCGKQSVSKSLPDLNIKSYDPCIPEHSKTPKPRDMLICLDVLEHVEPKFIDNVLKDLRRCTKKVGLICVSTVPAIQLLPDGRNAHLLVKDPHWWMQKLILHFQFDYFEKQPNEFLCVVR